MSIDWILFVLVLVTALATTYSAGYRIGRKDGWNKGWDDCDAYNKIPRHPNCHCQIPESQEVDK